MEKEAVKYVLDQTIQPNDRVVYCDEGTFIIDNDGNGKRVLPHAIRAERPLIMNTLSSLCQYIQANIERTESPLILRVDGPRNVVLEGLLEEDGTRETLAIAQVIVPDIDFDYPMDIEAFIIMMQSKFTEKGDRDALLQVTGNAVEENVKQVGDDGVSQSIVVRTGVTSKAEAVVPNPTNLAPFRTFLEVDQPESLFIFRMNDGPRCALYEADGGAWKNQAILNIRTFLEENLEEQIKSKRITLLA